MLRIAHKRTAYRNRVLLRADLVSVGEGGEGALVQTRLEGRFSFRKPDQCAGSMHGLFPVARVLRIASLFVVNPALGRVGRKLSVWHQTRPAAFRSTRRRLPVNMDSLTGVYQD